MLTTPGQSGPGSDVKKRVPHITGTSPSDCFALYPRHPLGLGSYPSAEKQPTGQFIVGENSSPGFFNIMDSKGLWSVWIIPCDSMRNDGTFPGRRRWLTFPSIFEYRVSRTRVSSLQT